MQQISIRFLIGGYCTSSYRDRWSQIQRYFKSLLPLFEFSSDSGNYVVTTYTIDDQGRMQERIEAPSLAKGPSIFYTDVHHNGIDAFKRYNFTPSLAQFNIIQQRVEDIYGILHLNKTPSVSLFNKKPLYMEEKPYTPPVEFKPRKLMTTDELREACKKAFGKENNSQIKPTNNMEKIKIDYVKKVVLSDTDAAVDAEDAVKHTAQRIDMCIMSKETEKSEKEMYIKSLEKEYPLNISALVEAKRELKKIVKDITILKEIKSELQLSAN